MTPAQAIASQPQVADPAPRSRFGTAVLPERSLKGLTVAALVDHDSLWICASKNGAGFAVRAAFCPAGELALMAASDEGAWTIDVATSVGPVRCLVSFEEAPRARLHLSSRLVPSQPFQLHGWPRDLVAFGPSRDPLVTSGVVHTKQRGLRTGVVYGSMTAPVEMTFLYLQDFSMLGAFLSDTKTSPADSVGGDWPLLGYAPAAGGPLDAAKEYVIADTYLILTEGAAIDDVIQAQAYLDLMADPYTALPVRSPRWHDWPTEALAVLRDLTFSPECSEERDGERYLFDLHTLDMIRAWGCRRPRRADPTSSNTEHAATQSRPVPWASHRRTGSAYHGPYTPSAGAGAEHGGDPHSQGCGCSRTLNGAPAGQHRAGTRNPVTLPRRRSALVSPAPDGHHRRDR